MKIYATRNNDYSIEDFIGEDGWVRVTASFADFVYVRFIAKFNDYLYAVNKVDSGDMWKYRTLYERGQLDKIFKEVYVHTIGSSDDLGDVTFVVKEPLDVMDTDELLDVLIRDFDLEGFEE